MVVLTFFITQKVMFLRQKRGKLRHLIFEPFNSYIKRDTRVDVLILVLVSSIYRIFCSPLMSYPSKRFMVVFCSLGKPIFPCQRVNARWGKLDCPERSCDLEGSKDTVPDR
jgi:hypothetical protein